MSALLALLTALCLNVHAPAEDEPGWNCWTQGNHSCGTLPVVGDCAYAADSYVMCSDGQTYWGDRP